jgi:hypothetical protein
MDTLNNMHKNNEKAQKQIHFMMEQLDLVDSFRELNPHIKRYTWRGPAKNQARLDYFLISSHLQSFIHESNIGIAYRSDHSPVYLTFQLTEHKRGKGTWKFNNCLLRDEEYIKIVKDCIAEVIGQDKTEDNENMFDIKFSIDDQLFWETLKIMLRGKTISYSTVKKKEREHVEFELELKLTILYQNGGTHEEEISKLESELKNIREEKVKGIITRAKAKWNIEGERSTRYFCNLEKRHYTEKIIPKLILEDNTEVTHQKDILAQHKLFYQTLYESTGIIFTDEHLKSFFDDNNP